MFKLDFKTIKIFDLVGSFIEYYLFYVRWQPNLYTYNISRSLNKL